MKKPTCKFCGKEFSLSPSQIEHGRTPEKSNQCNSCAVTRKRWKNKIELIELLGGKCERCGWAGHPAGFDFHHKNPDLKNFELNGNGLLLKSRIEEAKKCELLCRICHSIEHTNHLLIEKMGITKKFPKP